MGKREIPQPPWGFCLFSCLLFVLIFVFRFWDFCSFVLGHTYWFPKLAPGSVLRGYTSGSAQETISHGKDLTKIRIICAKQIYYPCIISPDTIFYFLRHLANEWSFFGPCMNIFLLCVGIFLGPIFFLNIDSILFSLCLCPFEN